MADFGDVFKEVITNKWSFLSFVLLVNLLLASIAGLVWGITSILHINSAQVTFSSEKNEILLQTTVGDKNQYQVLVNPQQAWQPTHIRVKQDEVIEFLADGDVNINLAGLVDYAQRREKLEAQVEDKHPGLRDDKDHRPEGYYTTKQWNQLKLDRPWNGPDGGDTHSKYQGRHSLRILPTENYGALIGVILDDDGETPRYWTQNPTDAFLVGRRAKKR